MTAKNLDPTLFGFKSVESLLTGLEVFVTVRGRNVMLRVKISELLKKFKKIVTRGESRDFSDRLLQY